MMHNAYNRARDDIAAFLAKKAEFDALLDELRVVSGDHFGVNPEMVLWPEVGWLGDVVEMLQAVAERFRGARHFDKQIFE